MKNTLPEISWVFPFSSFFFSLFFQNQNYDFSAKTGFDLKMQLNVFDKLCKKHKRTPPPRPPKKNPSPVLHENAEVIGKYCRYAGKRRD